jgi:hypothetical protein
MPTVYLYKEQEKPLREEGQMTVVLNHEASGWRLSHSVRYVPARKPAFATSSRPSLSAWSCRNIAMRRESLQDGVRLALTQYHLHNDQFLRKAGRRARVTHSESTVLAETRSRMHAMTYYNHPASSPPSRKGHHEIQMDCDWSGRSRHFAWCG